MAGEDELKAVNQNSVLTAEQDAILDMYLKSLDAFWEEIKNSEKVQVEIETQHLKRILTK
ncbi:MAG: hypothetical protein COW65_01765 [Cytophagales bacterium CG18_big_fil_WC_8_21_14_2_50_42_9]|nr:MAG: hypothetical protein COW65_01765 [Cytophagales bacterium CG18_big_fil_WC_8_21_14_2_50_42_9]